MNSSHPATAAEGSAGGLNARRQHRSLGVVIVTAAAILLIAPLLASAQPAPATGDSRPPAAAPAELSVIEQVQAKIKDLSQDTTLSKDEQSKAVEFYRLALSRLQDAKNYADNAARFERAAATAPMETAKIRQDLASPAQEEPGTALSQQASLKELEQLLATQQAQLTVLQGKLTDLNNQIATEQARPDSARAELADARSQLADIEKTLQAPPPANQPVLLTDANRNALSAWQQAYTNQVNMLEQELLGHDARLALLNAQRDALNRQISTTEAQLKQLQELINQQRLSEASQAAVQAEQTSRQAAGKPAVIRDAAAENATLSQQLADLAAQIDRTSDLQGALNDSLKRLENRYRRTREQLAIAGLSNALGPVLRSERQRLTDVREYRRSARKRTQQIEDARLKQFEIDEQSRKFSDIEQAIGELMANKPPPQLPPNQRQAIETELRQLLNDRQQLLGKLSSGYASYINQLVGLDHNQRQLLDQAQQYARLLDENLLWIASAKPVSMDSLPELRSSVQDLVSPKQLAGIADSLWQNLLRVPLLAGLVVLICVVLVLVRRHLLKRLKAMEPRIGNVSKDSFMLTLEALAITVLLVLPWPLLIGFFGWLLERSSDNSAFIRAVGIGLYNVALLFLVIGSFLQLCRNHGLAQLHFHWHEQTRAVLKRDLWWLLIAELLPTFLVTLTESLDQEAYRDSVGRLAFVFGSIVLGVFVWRVLRPDNGALAVLLKQNRGGWWWTLRHLWYPLIIATPLVLAGLALRGYYYTALELESRVFESGWLVVAIVIIGNLVVRWFNLSERQLALARARAKREATQTARASKESAKAGGEGVPEALDIPEIDLETISDQARGLLRLLASLCTVLGLWLIWYDLLPAFTTFKEMTLWQQTASIDNQQVIQVITLGNLILAILLTVLTFIVARNLPGALEITVLQRFTMKPGDRYAITSISRYLVVAVGIVLALKIIGLGWDQAQWLVAALSVGLGFGLQEIFANFVSGLILLFERPIRVGDTVTIGDYSGTVSRIRIRATTITDWDRKETLIPNKAFITGQLTNWTLSDPITRLVLPVGIAYGSDIRLAQRVLLAVAEANPLVLKEPAPAVLFLRFGDSSLDFEIRVFVKELADRIPLTHELNVSIEQALREHHIEIPFPQQDIHVRSVDQPLGLTGGGAGG